MFVFEHAPAQIITAPAQIITAPAQIIIAPAQQPATGAVVYTALFSASAVCLCAFHDGMYLCFFVFLFLCLSLSLCLTISLSLHLSLRLSVSLSPNV